MNFRVFSLNKFTNVKLVCIVFLGLPATNKIFLRGSSNFAYSSISVFCFFDPRDVLYMLNQILWLLLLSVVVSSTRVALVCKPFQKDLNVMMMSSARYIGERHSRREECCVLISIARVSLVASSGIEPSRRCISCAVEFPTKKVRFMCATVAIWIAQAFIECSWRATNIPSFNFLEKLNYHV